MNKSAVFSLTPRYAAGYPDYADSASFPGLASRSCRMARRTGIPASCTAPADVRADLRSRRQLHQRRRSPRGLRRAFRRRLLAERMESPRSKSNGNWVLTFHGIADNRIGLVSQSEFLLRGG